MTVNELRNKLAYLNGDMIVGVKMHTWDREFDSEDEDCGLVVAAYQETSDVSMFVVETEKNSICLLEANSFAYKFEKEMETKDL